MRSTQKQSVLQALKAGPKTTLELIRNLNVCCVTKRISELRRDGFEIVTSEQRFSGKRVVTYSLVPQRGQENADLRVLARTQPMPCAECGQEIVRESPKARPPRQGELPFCTDAHRARYHRRKSAQVNSAATGNPQDLQPMGNGARGV